MIVPLEPVFGEGLKSPTLGGLATWHFLKMGQAKAWNL